MIASAQFQIVEHGCKVGEHESTSIALTLTPRLSALSTCQVHTQ